MQFDKRISHRVNVGRYALLLSLALLFVASSTCFADELIRFPEIGRFDLTAGAGTEPIMRDNFLFIPNTTDGLSVLDVSDPTEPVMVAHFNSGIDNVYAVRLKDDFAFITDGTNGLRVLDISSLRNVDLGDDDLSNDFATFSEITSPDGQAAWKQSSSSLTGLDIVGDRVFVCRWPEAGVDDQDLYVLDISDLAEGAATVEIRRLAAWTDPYLPKPAVQATLRGLRVCGDHAYVAGGMGGTRILDVSEENILHDTIIQTGYFSDLGRSESLEDIYPELIDGPVGYSNIPLKTPYLPYNVSDNIELDVQGNYLYIADGDGGIEVCRKDRFNGANNYNDDNTPLIAGYYDAGPAACVKVRGNYIFATAQQGGGTMFVLDSNQLDNETHFMKKVGVSEALQLYYIGLLVNDGIAYAMPRVGHHGVRILDVSMFTTDAQIPVEGYRLEDFINGLPVSSLQDGCIALLTPDDLSIIPEDFGETMLLGGEAGVHSMTLRDAFIFKESKLLIDFNILKTDNAGEQCELLILVDGQKKAHLDISDPGSFGCPLTFTAFENEGSWSSPFTQQTGFMTLSLGPEWLQQHVGLDTDIEFRLLDTTGCYALLIDNIREADPEAPGTLPVVTIIPEPLSLAIMAIGIAASLPVILRAKFGINAMKP